MNKNNRFNNDIINKFDKIRTKYENKKENIKSQISKINEIKSKIDELNKNICESAKYGNEFIFIDVTDIINNLIKNKMTDFIINDSLFSEKSKKIKI